MMSRNRNLEDKILLSVKSIDEVRVTPTSAQLHRMHRLALPYVYLATKVWDIFAYIHEKSPKRLQLKRPRMK